MRSAPSSGGDLTAAVYRTAQRRPESIALLERGSSLTYAGLLRWADRLAARLRSCGVRRGDTVAVLADRRIETVVAELAVLRASAAFVPLDPEWPEARTAFVLEDSGASVLVHADETDALRDYGDRVRLVPSGRPPACDEPPASPADEDRVPRMPAASRDAAYVIYTSGSTGTPKGVVIEHRNAANLVASLAPEIGITPGKRVLVSSSFTFDVSVFEVFGPLTVGGTAVVATDADRKDAGRLQSLVEDLGVDVVQATPSVWQALLDSGFAPLRPLTVLTAGEALRGDLLGRLLGLGPTWNLYGPTEATIYATGHRFTAPMEAQQPCPIGASVAGAVLKVVTADGTDARPGETGELWIGGPGVARGYLDRPELTRERFVPDPASGPDARFYRTGDLVRLLDGGSLVFIGREDRQIKLRGHRIELDEVEAVLERQPDVARAVVSAREGPSGDLRILAHVVPAGTAQWSPSSLRDRIAQEIPGYMVPSWVVPMAELPTTTSGKVAHSELPDPDAWGAVRAQDPAPFGSVEARVRSVWSDVLQVAPSAIADHGFLDLGAHSLLAMKAAARLSRELGTDITGKALLDNPSARDLADAVAGASGAGTGPPSPAPGPRPRPADGWLPVTIQQQQVWFMEELRPGNLAYNAQASLRVRGPLRVDALERALSRIVERHEILRSTYRYVSGAPRQRVEEPWPVRLSVTDVAGEQGLREWMDEQLSAAFSIDTLPLVRWSLARLDDDEHVFLTVEHHFVHDGFTWAVFWGELFELYEAECLGRAPSLPPAPAQYGDYAIWQQELIDADCFTDDLRYWERLLRDAPPASDRHLDHPRPPMPSLRGRTRRVRVDQDTYEALRSLAREHSTSLFVVMLAAFAVVVSRWTEHQDLVLGTAVANRAHEELETLMGMVVNTIPLRLRVPDDSPESVIPRVHEAWVDAFDHGGVPFGLIVKAVAGQPTVAHNPLFQVMFSFHDGPVPRPRFAALDGEITEESNGSAKFDLNVIVVPQKEQRAAAEEADDGDLFVLWEHALDVIDTATADRLLDEFQALLTTLARQGSDTAHLGTSAVVLPQGAGGPASPAGGLDESDTEERHAIADEGEADGGAPGTTTAEQRLRAIWEECLGVDDISPEDNFFEVGGDSLLAMRMLARLREEWQPDVQLSMIFRNPTLRDLADALAGADAARTA